LVEGNHQWIDLQGVALEALRSFLMSEIAWLEVSLEADGEMAEAISEVLARYVSGGVVIESTHIEDEPEGEGYPTGPLRVSGYIPFNDRLEQTRQKLEEALWHLGQVRPVSQIHFRAIEDLDWSAIWKDHFQPVQIGKDITIIPVWMEVENDQRIAIKIDPGMAFGTGTHPTTQLCLEVLTEILDEFEFPKRSAFSMIDVGCGSGILGIAALKLGVGTVLGVDLDQEAVESAHKNARVNGEDEHLNLEVGSLDEIKGGKCIISNGQIVVANILAPVIICMLQDGLGGIVAPGGKLVLSGILAEQSAEIESVLKDVELKLVQKKQSGDWIVLVAEQGIGSG
jgi:ribosomal protein L11 methyltransferase